jgi:hypothetical protein
MKRIVLAFAALCALALPARAQCPDLLAYVEDIFGDDPDTGGTREACLLALFSQGKTYFDREVLPRAEKALQSDNPRRRTAASGIFMMMTFVRHDSGEVLANSLPILAKYVGDDEHKVRQNTLITITKILGQIPSPPDGVLDALISATTGGVETPRAFYALTQVHPMPERISKVLIAELQKEADAERKGDLLRSFGQTRDLRPEILATLLMALRSEQEPVLHGALSALAELGPKAASASPEVRRLAETATDPTLKQTAAGVAQRLESPGKR